MGHTLTVSSTVATVGDAAWPEERRGRSPRRASLVGVSVVGPLVLFLVVWVLTGPGANNAGHVIVALWFGTLVVMLAVVAFALKAHQARRSLRLGLVVFAVLALVGIGYWTLSAGLSEVKLSGDVSSWNRALAGVHADDAQYEGCKVPAPGVTLAGYGPISEVCVLSRTVDSGRSVSFAASNTNASLYYYRGPGLPPAYDSCVRQVSGPWWQAVPIGQSLNCSVGFRSVGGP
jgi:hypothetical protein